MGLTVQRKAHRGVANTQTSGAVMCSLLQPQKRSRAWLPIARVTKNKIDTDMVRVRDAVFWLALDCRRDQEATGQHSCELLIYVAV